MILPSDGLALCVTYCQTREMTTSSDFSDWSIFVRKIESENIITICYVVLPRDGHRVGQVTEPDYTLNTVNEIFLIRRYRMFVSDYLYSVTFIR